MKKILKFILILIILGITIFIGYKFLKNDKKEAKDSKPKIKQELTIEEKVDEMLSKMSKEEKIGQMLIISNDNKVVTEEMKNSLEEIKPGGFIIFKQNISTYEKTKKFISDIKSTSKIPMIISTDEEGGLVQRLKAITDKEVTDIPQMYDVGLKNDLSLAYEVGKVMAEELRTLGINVTHAPVVDIYSNPKNTVIGKRSFGNNPTLVSQMANRLANGLEENGVIATYKHFPGHGDTEVDSHKSLPVINKSKEEIENLELIPFKNAISNGAKIIMIGHLSFPKLTNDNTPTSLSKIVITDLLKQELGFNGLVITDALNMGALVNEYTNEEITLKVIEAGADLLLMPVDPITSIKVIKENVTDERIDESVRKILIFKYKYLNKDNTLDVSYLNNEEHKNVIKKIKK